MGCDGRRLKLDRGQPTRDERVRTDFNILKILDGFSVSLKLDQPRSNGSLGGLAQNPIADLNRVVDLLLQTPNRVKCSLTYSISEDDKALINIVVFAVTLVEEIRTILGSNKLGELTVKLAVVAVDELGPMVGTLSLVKVVLLNFPLKVFPVTGVILPLIGLG